MSTSAPSDLHAAFSAPAAAPVDDRERFLRAVDRLPGLVPVRAALRRAATPPDGGTVVDAGCGLGLETARLAAGHPAATVVGLDHDPGILAAARRMAPDLPNLRWATGDLTAPDLPPASVDAVRTERVLIYVADLGAAAEAIRAVLRPGGVFAGFELDYGATVLPPAGRSPQAVRRLTACLEDSLPQPWAGRVLPEALTAHSLEVVTVEPFAFAVDRPVWQRIVVDTLRAAATAGRLDAPELDAWLAAVDAADVALRAAFIGTVTVARRTG